MSSRVPKIDLAQGPARPIERFAIVLCGIVATQVLLYGPSLVGQRVLLPLDILKMENCYLPLSPEFRPYLPSYPVLSDEIMVVEPFRQFAVREVRAGRLPLWNPHNYCGAPFLAANQPALFSPYRVLDYLFPGTLVIAWAQLVKSLVAGTGAYVFFRRALGARFWPATLGAWCFPIIGCMVLWRGFPMSAVLSWLPWMLYCIDAVARRPASFAAPGLALTTCAMLLGGHAATAAQALIPGVGYGVYRVASFRGVADRRLHALRSFAALSAAVLLGALLSAPQSLPTLEYLSESNRVVRRVAGEVETPPRGLSALPQLVLPNFYGSERQGRVYLAAGISVESAPAGYAGLLVTLWLAPFAFGHRTQRGQAFFWLALGLLGSAQVLDLPGQEWLFSAPPFSASRNNRLVFLTAWSCLTLGVLGFDAVLGARRLPDRTARAALLLAILAAAVLAGWCLWWLFAPPAFITKWRNTTVFAPLMQTYLAGVALTAVVVFGLWSYARRVVESSWEVATLLLLVAGELLVTAQGVNPQCDPRLYYPALPVLDELKQLPAGRAYGIGCLPVSLNLTYGLADVRGYDGTDPGTFVELLRDIEIERPEPAVWQDDAHQRPLPRGAAILDMLNLRYQICRGLPPYGLIPKLTGDDYYVAERPRFLPRAFVPRRLIQVADKERRLALLHSSEFDPRELAILEEAMPARFASAADGSAEIIAEDCNQVAVNVALRTPGCVVLADRWAPGWEATFNGRPARVLRVNHALRGVLVEKGQGQLVFRYRPRSLTYGLWIAALAAIVMLLWSAVLLALRAKRPDKTVSGSLPSASMPTCFIRPDSS